jgi:hypothetical protein
VPFTPTPSALGRCCAPTCNMHSRCGVRAVSILLIGRKTHTAGGPALQRELEPVQGRRRGDRDRPGPPGAVKHP